MCHFSHNSAVVQKHLNSVKIVFETVKLLLHSGEILLPSCESFLSFEGERCPFPLNFCTCCQRTHHVAVSCGQVQWRLNGPDWPHLDDILTLGPIWSGVNTCNLASFFFLLFKQHPTPHRLGNAKQHVHPLDLPNKCCFAFCDGVKMQCQFAAFVLICLHHYHSY